MWVLVVMLLVGLLAGVQGFTMCFMPAQWNRLRRKLDFADRWSAPSHGPLDPIIGIASRVAGMVIFAGGCWFTWLAALGIYRVLTGQAVMHMAVPTPRTLPTPPTPALTALSVFMLGAGALMAASPTKALAIFARAWPGRSVKPSPDRKVVLFVRVVGIFFALLAIMSLVN